MASAISEPLPPPSHPPTDDQFPFDAYVNKKTVAMRHRDMIVGFFATVLLFVAYLVSVIVSEILHLQPVLQTVSWLVFVVAHAYTAIQGCRLKYGLGENMFFSFLFGVWMAMPILNLAAIISVHNEALRLLRRAGLRIGVMGVNEREYNRRYAPWLCSWCDYDLTGNCSGVCSECGKSIPADTLAVIAQRESSVVQTKAT